MCFKNKKQLVFFAIDSDENKDNKSFCKKKKHMIPNFKFEHLHYDMFSVRDGPFHKSGENSVMHFNEKFHIIVFI